MWSLTLPCFLTYNRCTKIAQQAPCTQAFFEAVSGDYAIKKKKGSLKPGSFGRLANVDEVYPCFLAFGLLTSESSKGSIGVNSHTSLLNRFLQTGTSGRITRTAGAYGGAAAKPVSFALVGNAHPSTVLAMLDGTSGHQVAAAHDIGSSSTHVRELSPMKQSPARLQFEARGTCGRHFQTSWQRLLV